MKALSLLALALLFSQVTFAASKVRCQRYKDGALDCDNGVKCRNYIDGLGCSNGVRCQNYINGFGCSDGVRCQTYVDGTFACSNGVRCKSFINGTFCEGFPY